VILSGRARDRLEGDDLAAHLRPGLLDTPLAEAIMYPSQCRNAVHANCRSLRTIDLAEDHLIIGVSGVRGIVFDPLSPDVCARIAAAFAGLAGNGAIVVGRDTRPSGEILKMAAIAGLASAGADVIDLGLATTPTVQLAVEHHRASGGIAVTASHNGAEWNALKLISRSGTFLAKGEVEKVAAMFRSGRVSYLDWKGGGTLSADQEAGRRHIARVLGSSFIRPEAIKARAFRVAIDCVNGAASVVVPEMLAELGCTVSAINSDTSGDFKRSPEPVAENLGGLRDLVKRDRADVGFAFDPDGDRLALVTEKGDAPGEDMTLAVCADLVLGKSKGPLVTNLSTSRVVEDVAGKHGVPFYRTAIGEINVVAGMKRVGAAIGGEGNGGVILPEIHYGRDALVGLALVLQAMLEAGKQFSEIVGLYPGYAIVKEKVELERMPDFEELASALREQFVGAEFNVEDGVRIDLGRSWLHVRRSGTEPVVRLIAEAPERSQAQDLIRKARNAIR